MNTPSGSRVALNLYKRLLRYGNQLQLTDKDYYLNRVRSEFHRNKKLKLDKEIEFSLNVIITYPFLVICIIIPVFYFRKARRF